MKRAGIYRLLNTRTGKSYVGSSVDIERRQAQHFSALTRGTAGSPKLQNAYNKYGAASFVFEILEDCEPDRLEAREAIWIETYNALKAGYNCSSDVKRSRASGLGRRRTGTGYPVEWPEIRARIASRDSNRCQRCGVRNFSVGIRKAGGGFQLFREADSLPEARGYAAAAVRETGKKHSVIILACAHLTNPDPHDCREENLGMLCEYHHLQVDRYHHSVNARKSWQAKRVAQQQAEWEEFLQSDGSELFGEGRGDA